MVRPSISAAASNAGAVRAMAAMFDMEPHLDNDHKEASPESENLGNHALTSQDPQTKTIRTSTSASMLSHAEVMSPAKSRQSSHKYSMSGPASTVDETIRRASLADSVASRAKELMSAPGVEVGISVAQRSPLSKKASSWQQTIENAHPSNARNPGNLGKILPPQEVPPVARNLNLPRPPSTVPGTPSLDLNSLEDEERTVPAPRPGSTTLLHSQIRNLQRQLDAKTEETSQLRRQLEAQVGTDAGTLSEQLREAKREVAIWKERAEAAERRVQVFEKFTAKLRGIREAAAAAEQQEGTASQCNSDDEQSSECDDSSNAENISPAQHVKFAHGRRVGKSTETCGSGGSGQTEDAGLVTARIRKCLHGGAGTTDGADDDVSNWPDACPQDVPGGAYGAAGRLPGTGLRAVSSSSRRNISESALEIWFAAQELLEDRDRVIGREPQDN